jgi:hypothetical protein
MQIWWFSGLVASGLADAAIANIITIFSNLSA